MTLNNDMPTVLIKRKNIQTIFDYCMDNKIEFSVKEKPFTVEEYEVVLNIEEIKQAIALGIFARESRIEIVGVNDKQQTQNKNTRKSTTSTPTKPVDEIIEKEETVVMEEPEEISFHTEERKPENKGFSLDLSPSLSFS